MKAFFWTADQGGCGHYRMINIAQQMAKAGHDATHSHLLGEHFFEQDVLVTQRTVNEGASELWQEIAAIPRPLRPLMIIDLDDDLWSIDPSNPAYAFYDEEMLGRLTANVYVADAVTVSTPELAEVIGKINPNVYVLENCIPESLLSLDPEPGRPLTIGWAGSRTHDVDFRHVAKPLSAFIKKNPDLRYVMIGWDYRDMLTKQAAKHVELIAWSESLPKYYESLRQIDIGIAPLYPNIFNNSKSHIKALEYAALGIPTVASALPPYNRFVTPAIGYLARHDDQWGKALTALLDPPHRGSLGVAAKAKARQYTIETRWQDWANLYEKLAVKPLTAVQV